MSGGAVAEESASAAGLMTNEHGLEYVKLVNGDSSADIYLYGGVVTSYIKEGIEYIAVRPDAKTDGSKPISGGLSHCWPQVSLINSGKLSLIGITCSSRHLGLFSFVST